MKGISTRGLTFAEIREKDKYYVDKSLLIKDIFDSDGEGVYLFTRPRRFGKTTNLSMLDAFFNMNYKGNTWFDDLEISKYPEYERYKNAFPVIYLNLKEAEVSTYEDFVTRIRVELCKAYEENSHLIDMSALTISQDELFQSIIRKKNGGGIPPRRHPVIMRAHTQEPRRQADHPHRRVRPCCIRCFRLRVPPTYYEASRKSHGCRAEE